MYGVVVSSMLAACPAHVIHLVLITVTMLDDEQKL